MVTLPRPALRTTRSHPTRTGRRALVLALAAASVVGAGLSAGSASAGAGAGGSGEPGRVATLTNIYNNPNANYLAAASCLVPLASVPDFTLVPSVVACGQTVTFTAPPQKLTVPVSWPSPWGTPAQTEVPNPEVLWTNGQQTLQITFSSPRRVAGFEISPQLGTVQSFKADYIDASGNLIGTVPKTVMGGGARLIGARTQAATKVSTILISSNGDFAVARVRFRP